MRYDVRTGMVQRDQPDSPHPGALRPREERIPGWHVPGHSRYGYDLRIGDAERDAATAELREHFAAGRLTLDELTERIDAALTAKTQRQIDALMADLPRLPKPRVKPSEPMPGSRHDTARYVVLALLLFALATWLLMMALMARYAYVHPYGPPDPGGFNDGG